MQKTKFNYPISFHLLLNQNNDFENIIKDYILKNLNELKSIFILSDL